MTAAQHLVLARSCPDRPDLEPIATFYGVPFHHVPVDRVRKFAAVHGWGSVDSANTDRCR